MKKIILLVLFPVLCYANPVYVDLNVGDSTYFDGHTVKLISQSLDDIVVTVDGVGARLKLNGWDCGSPRQALFENVNGVMIMPDIVSDVQFVCSEPQKNRRWERFKFSLNDGARLVLKKPGEDLPKGFFPIIMNSPCEFLKQWRRHYYVSEVYYGIHAGVDFQYPIGAKIVAARGGQIVSIVSDYRSGMPCDYRGGTAGNYVKIQDNDFNYVYFHMDTVNSSLYVGQWVSAGTHLGTLGCTGTLNSHLHFSIRLLKGISPNWELMNINAYPYLENWACSGSTLPVGHLDYCRDEGPCEEGEGDCDNDGECAGDLICGQVVGIDYCEEPGQQCYDVITTECQEVVTTICP